MMRRAYLAALRQADAGGDACAVLAASDFLSEREHDLIRAAADAATLARTAAERRAADALAAALPARARLLCRVAREVWISELCQLARDFDERGWKRSLALALDCYGDIADIRPLVIANGADKYRVKIAVSWRATLRVASVGSRADD